MSMMYEIAYDLNYTDGKRQETEQVTEGQLARMRKYEAKGEYYSNITVIKELGEEDTSLINCWVAIGKSNAWIREADDPPFSERYFSECKTPEYLVKKLIYGNWSLGVAFYYKSLCFINQIEGGSEFLVIRNDVAFESFSCKHMIKADGEQAFIDLVNRLLSSEVTDEMLLRWDYK